MKWYLGFLCIYQLYLIYYIFLLLNVSSLSEIEDSLPPGKAVYYTWADPVGSRKLKWSCGQSHGEVTHKDVSTKSVIMGFSAAFLFFDADILLPLVDFKDCFWLFCKS